VERCITEGFEQINSDESSSSSSSSKLSLSLPVDDHHDAVLIARDGEKEFQFSMQRLGNDQEKKQFFSMVDFLIVEKKQIETQLEGLHSFFHD